MNPLKPIFEYLEKARSRIYGVFIFWIVILNLPALFTSIFIDQDLIYNKTGLLKGEYIAQNYYAFNWQQWVGYILIDIILAATLTWIMIWILPKSLIKLAYQRELRDQYDREAMRLDEEEKLNNRKEQIATQQLEVVREESKVVTEQESLEKREETNWQRDYHRFSKTKYYKTFNSLIRCIYEYSGYVKADYDEYNNGGWAFELSPDILAYADSLELVKYRESGNNIERIEFTAKGKYFVREFQARE